LAPALEQRLHDSLETFHAPWPAGRARGPGVLNERLLSARWSI
jgi:FMN reductase